MGFQLEDASISRTVSRGETSPMESIIKDTPAQKRRKFDEPFKIEVIRNRLSSGWSAAVIAKELGPNESLLFAWRKLLPPADAGG